MREVIDLYKKAKGFLSQAEELYDIAQARGSHDPLEVILPLVYSQFMNKPEFQVDQRAVLFSGQYFASKYPHLKDYFLDEEHQAQQQAVSQELADIVREQTREPAQKTITVLSYEPRTKQPREE